MGLIGEYRDLSGQMYLQTTISVKRRLKNPSNQTLVAKSALTSHKHNKYEKRLKLPFTTIVVQIITESFLNKKLFLSSFSIEEVAI
jgi:hypothetical protein